MKIKKTFEYSLYNLYKQINLSFTFETSEEYYGALNQLHEMPQRDVIVQLIEQLETPCS